MFLALKIILKEMNLRGTAEVLDVKIRHCSQMTKYCSKS
ncbi:MAG: conserved hypothetical protein [Methanobrevibacter sp. CfCl-M3]